MQDIEKTSVLVVGAAGSFGSAVLTELVRRGHRVRAVRRPGGRRVGGPGVEAIEADVTDRAALAAVARGAEVIVWGFNLAYDRWHPGVVDAARVVGDVAAELGALVVVPGNVYGLGPDFSAPLAEDAPRRCPSRKGRIRNEMESVLEQACERGARLLIVRAGDFFGAGSEGTSWFHFMTRGALKGGALWQPAPDHVPHAWAYLPDLARVTVTLIERRADLARSEVFHFAGHAVDGASLMEVVRAALGDPQRKVRRVPWRLLRALGWTSSMLREILEMRYLWEEPVLLDEGKLRRWLGQVPHTPLEQAVRETFAHYVEREVGSAAPASVVADA